MTDPAAKARELMAAIRYQVHRPEVTTMGPCPRCGESSRGAGKCCDCLGVALDCLLDSIAGTEYVNACRDAAAAERAILEALGGGDG